MIAVLSISLRKTFLGGLLTDLTQLRGIGNDRIMYGAAGNVTKVGMRLTMEGLDLEQPANRQYTSNPFNNNDIRVSY
jgi:hypothetical protein